MGFVRSDTTIGWTLCIIWLLDTFFGRGVDCHCGKEQIGTGFHIDFARNSFYGMLDHVRQVPQIGAMVGAHVDVHRVDGYAGDLD